MRRLPVLLALALAAPAVASVVREVPLSELARRSDLVVRGEVASVRSTVADEGRRVFTVVTVRVAETLKGEAREEVVVVVPGGRRGHLEQRLAGVPVLAAGEGVVLFLDRRPGPEERFRLSAFGLGVWRVEGELAVRASEGLEVVTGELETPRPAAAVRMPLTDLVRAVRGP